MLIDGLGRIVEFSVFHSCPQMSEFIGTRDNRPAVLILAHSWPPDANVGAVRPVYLSRQLARLGMRPIVITVREEYHELRNEGGIAGADSALVIRTRCMTNPRYAYLWLKTLAMRLLRIRPTATETTSPGLNEIERSSLVTGVSLKRNIISLLYTPDEFLGWFPFALVASLRAISVHRPLCVISTGPPHTSHLIAMVLKRLRHIPWIADLRDPWAWHDLPADTPQLWSDRISTKLELLMIEQADRVVCVAPAVTKTYAEKYPETPAAKWVTISNGFDLDEFRGLGAVKQAERFTISYVGGFDFQRSPLLLLRAIAELIAEGVIDPQKIAVRFVGPCEFANGQPMAAMIQELGLTGIAEVVPLVPRPQALRELLSAHALLLLAGTQRLSVAAKVYEYLAAGRPILAISAEGAAADIIRRAGSGRVVAPDDLQGAKSAVAYWYTNHFAQGSLGTNQKPEISDAALEYSWERLGARYAELIRASAVA